MAYRIAGLDPATFADLFALGDAELSRRMASRVIAPADRGYPCRISLEDARQGEELILLHHLSHDVATPYRSSYAIYVRRDVRRAEFIDALPPVFAGRPLGMRGFDAKGNLRAARLALPDAAEGAIHGLFADPEIAYIHAHNAAHGCFAARIERHGDLS